MESAADAAAAALGAWASIRGFFTPATLFIVVNLVIGTIALSSRFQQRRRRDISYTAHDADAHHQEPPFQHAQHQDNNYYDDQHQHQQYVPPPPAPEPLARTSSVLDRLRSIGLYRFRSGDFPPEYAAGTDSMSALAPASGDAQHARSRSAPAPVREVRRRPAASRTRKSPRSIKPEVAPARLVQAAVVEEVDDDDVEEEYTRADEFTGSNFTTEPLSPVSQLQEEEEEQSYRDEYVPPLRHARPPSVLERIRSFGFRSSEPAADHAANAVPVEEEGDDVEEEEYARADVFTDANFTTHRQQQQPPARHEEEQYYREEYVPPQRPAPLARPPPPSVMERLRSFGLSRFSSGNIGADDAAAAVVELERNQAQKQAKMTKSRSEPSREQSNKGKKQQQESAQAKMSKSSSVARKPAPASEEPQAEVGGVDARADDFINSFRKQLQLQRLNSLLNYKDMLNRGA